MKTWKVESTARRKIAIIGCGNIGGLAAYIIGMKQLADVVLLDVHEGIAKGKALDLTHADSVNGWGVSFHGSASYSDIDGADVVIVTAGIARKPGMTRADLLAVNAKIIAGIAENVKQYAPNSFVIVITNPLDAMVMFFQKCSGFDPKRVVGMAGELDNARFRAFLANELTVPVAGIESMVIGTHGELMLPLVKRVKVAGDSIEQLVKDGKITWEQLQLVVERTRCAGAEIVSLLQFGSAFAAPAALAVEMATAYLHDQKRTFCAAAYIDKTSNVAADYSAAAGMYIGVPVIVGSGGVESIIELKLDATECGKFEEAVEAVKELLSDLPPI
jgi:malate dehydrogenase